MTFSCILLQISHGISFHNEVSYCIRMTFYCTFFKKGHAISLLSDGFHCFLMTFSAYNHQKSHIPAKTDLRPIQKTPTKKDLRHIQKTPPKPRFESLSKSPPKATPEARSGPSSQASLPILILRNHIEDFLRVLGVLARHIFHFVLGIACNNVFVVFHTLS